MSLPIRHVRPTLHMANGKGENHCEVTALAYNANKVRFYTD